MQIKPRISCWQIGMLMLIDQMTIEGVDRLLMHICGEGARGSEKWANSQLRN